MKKCPSFFTAAIGLGVFMLTPAADARIWTDSTGTHKVEAEFVSLEGDNVELKTPAGRLVKLSLAKLSEADRAIAIKLGAPVAAAPGEPEVKPANPATIPAGDMTVTAKGKLEKSVSIIDGQQKMFSKLKIVVTALGGVAADAYSLGPITADPISIDGAPLKLDTPTDFALIDRSKEGFFAKHPKNGINAVLEFGEVPESTKSVGPLKGSVKVLAGGTEKTVVISDALTRQLGIINDPVLKAAGLEVKFTRQILDENIQVGVAISGKSSAAFAALELVDSNSAKVDVGDGSMIDNISGDATYTKSAPKAVLEKATLKFRFREGGKEMAIPFDIPEVMVEK